MSLPLPHCEPPDLGLGPLQFVTSHGSTAPAPGFSFLTAAMLPEPYGPDPVVFGWEPRVKVGWI